MYSRFLVKFSLSKVTVHFSRVVSVPSPYLAPAGVLWLFHGSEMRTAKCQAGEKRSDSAALHAHPLLWGMITGVKSKQSFPLVIPSTSPFLPASVSHSEEEQLLKGNKLRQKVQQHVLAFKKFGTATAFTAYDSNMPHQRHRSAWSKQHII